MISFEVNDYMLGFLKDENIGFEVIERTAFDEAKRDTKYSCHCCIIMEPR